MMMPDERGGRDSASEAVRLAVQWYSRDHRRGEGEQRQEELSAAAQELGIPIAYLERAHAHLAEKRAARARFLQRAKVIGVFGLGALTGLAVGRGVQTQPAPPAVAITTPAEVVPAPPALNGGVVYWDNEGQHTVILREHLVQPFWRLRMARSSR